jgi:endonuclease/exonuclease/phosphatase family metal-dependent hydrolase
VAAACAGGGGGATPGPLDSGLAAVDAAAADGARVDAAHGAPDAAAVDAARPDGAPTPEPVVVTMVSFNLLHGFPDFMGLDERTAIVADFIDTVQPDVIAVQEVGQTPTLPNRAQVLADLTGYEWVWEKASGVSFVFEEGPGILSRWPIVASEAVELPHPGLVGFEVRKAVGAWIATPHGQIVVFSAHLTTQDDETIKADQALTAYERVRAGVTDRPGFFAGDMNAAPDSLPMRFLRGEATHAGVTGDLIDAWPVANPGDPGFTNDPESPSERIDYVYVVPGSAGAGTILDCELVFADPVGGVYASDHIGVLCHVALPTV